MIIIHLYRNIPTPKSTGQETQSKQCTKLHIYIYIMNYITTFNWNKLLALDSRRNCQSGTSKACCNNGNLVLCHPAVAWMKSLFSKAAVFLRPTDCSKYLKTFTMEQLWAAIVLHFGDPSWSWISMDIHCKSYHPRLHFLSLFGLLDWWKQKQGWNKMRPPA